MKFCLAEKKRGSSALATVVDCSNPKNLIRYRAYNGEEQFGIEIVSYLSETESASGKDRQTQTPRLKSNAAATLPPTTAFTAACTYKASESGPTLVGG